MHEAKTKVVFYNDSPIIGGHEIMTARMANVLAETPDYDTTFLYYQEEFDSLLHHNIRRTRLPFHAKSVRPLRGGSIVGQIRSLGKLFSAASPLFCVVSQGYIESGVRGLLAARHLNIPALSYIPFGYSNKELHSRFATIRDLFTGRLFQLPNAFITISQAQSELLTRFTSSDTEIYVVPNPAELDGTAAKKSPPAVTEDTLRIGVVGRINFQQKNQDACVPVAQLLKSRQFPFHFHIVGDGPDKQHLEGLIREQRLGDAFTLHGWINSPALPSFLTSQVDMLLIPSHYEGVPLIMLEAFKLGIPFLISDRHFVQDYHLPTAMLINPLDTNDISDKLYKFNQNIDLDAFKRLCEESLKIHSQTNFSASVLQSFDNFATQVRQIANK